MCVEWGGHLFAVMARHLIPKQNAFRHAYQVNIFNPSGGVA